MTCKLVTQASEIFKRCTWRVALLALGLVAASPSAQAMQVSEHALRIENKQTGNVVLGADAAVIARGEIYHSVVLLWGNLAIAGEVDEVVILSGKVVFEPGAQLKKSLVVMGGAFESLPGSIVPPEVVTLKNPGVLWRLVGTAGSVWRENVGWVAKLLGALASALVFWGIGLVVFSLFPSLQANTANRLGRQWGQNLLAGLLGTILVPVLFVLLLISIVGILALPIYAALLVLAGFLSYLAAALWAGHRLLPPKPDQKLNPLGFFLGILAFQMLWALSYWGGLAVLVLWTLGWGALIRSLKALWR